MFFEHKIADHTSSRCLVLYYVIALKIAKEKANKLSKLSLCFFTFTQRLFNFNTVVLVWKNKNSENHHDLHFCLFTCGHHIINGFITYITIKQQKTLESGSGFRSAL